jgi:hypothetical protein
MIDLSRAQRGAVMALAVLALTGAFALRSASALGLAPSISNESSANVGSSEATVSAQIDAQSLPTTYRVEYGIGITYAASTSEESASAGSAAIGVQVQLSGLQPSTVYHYRFVAESEAGKTEGSDATFTTTAAVGSSASLLPDERYYELVSPPSGVGEIYHNSLPVFDEADHPTDRDVFQAAENGNAVAYVADPGETTGNGARGDGLGNQWLASRTGTGWEATDITPIGEGEGSEQSDYTEYQGFSGNLSIGIFTATSPLLESVADPNAPGCAAGGAGLTQSRPLYAHTGVASFSSLFTSTATGSCGAPRFAGSSADGSSVFFQTEARLIENAPEVPGSQVEEKEGCAEGCDLYDATGGQVSLVNILPDGVPADGATYGSPPALAPRPGTSPGLDNVISADGSRAYWTDTQAGSDLDHIYLRDDETTVPVSQGPAQYWAATPDGRYAFYTEAEQLWRFDAESGTRDDIASVGAGGQSAEVKGVMGVSGDGTYVAFVAASDLAPGTETRKCSIAEVELRELERTGNLSSAEEEQLRAEEREEEAHSLPLGRGCNLYVEHVGEAPRFVAALSAADDENNLQSDGGFYGLVGDWEDALGNRTAAVAADGQGLVFESLLHLTGYDNTGELEREGGPPRWGSREIFVYEIGTGKLVCVSCNPTGGPPSAAQYGSQIPVHQGDNGVGETSQVRWISADGHEVFFQTSQSLVPQDTNGMQDVYEWEQEGSPSCPSEPPGRLDGGCLFLLSGGDSADNSFLIDASESGGDVFFSSRAHLVSQEVGDKSEVYDARVHGGFPEYSLACVQAGCQGVPPSLPIFATPASATFEGVGNFEPQINARPSKGKSKPRSRKCTSEHTKRHARCTKAKRRPKKANTAVHERRGGGR